MSRFLNENLKSLESYTPGEQPRDKKYIKLNTNESPYPPSPEVIQAVSSDEVSDLRLYSDPTAKRLKEKIAKRYDVTPENVFVSNGSDESLNFFFMAFCSKENKVIFPEISYGFYKVFCDLYGISYEQIPLTDDFSINVDDYINVNKHIVIANPNAPTGLALSTCEIEKIVKSNPDNLVLIDEAYVDFGAETCLPLIDACPNLLIVRTFSKSRSMAGARLGYGFACESLIAEIETIRNAINLYSVNRMTQAAGVAACRENEYYVENCQRIVQARDYTTQMLREQGFEVLDSLGNFVFAKPHGMGAAALKEQLAVRGILVRHWDAPRVRDYLRISIGTMQQMQALDAAIEMIFGRA